MEPGRGAAVLDGGERAIPPVGGPIAPTLGVLLAAVAGGVEVLFPIVHGSWGEDGSLQGLCEMLDLPYVGPGVTASAVAIDKLFTKRLLAAAGIPVLACEAADRREVEEQLPAVLARCERLPLPLFVKPRSGGSSVGVRRVDGRDALAAALRFALRFDDGVLVERGVQGRELECAVLGYDRIEASAIGEVVPASGFYDYAAKYLDDSARLVAPAELPEDLAATLRRLAAAAFAAVGGTGLARVDFLVEQERTDGSGVFVNEINTLPGFTAISMYPRLWEISGLPLPQLTDRLVSIAQRRHADRRRLDAGIKSWLAEL